MEHKIKVDENISIMIDIPEEMDIPTFMGIAEKVKPLMKQSTLYVNPPQEMTRDNPLIKQKFVGLQGKRGPYKKRSKTNGAGRPTFWTPQKNKEYMRLWDFNKTKPQNYAVIAGKLGITASGAENHFFMMSKDPSYKKFVKTAKNLGNR